MSVTKDEVSLNLSSNMICSAVKSFTLSKRFTKVLMKASILNILYQRLMLNESDLKQRNLEGTPIAVFRRSKKYIKDPLLSQYITWMEGVIDAIDKNYLKNLFLFMRNPVNDDLIESYRFLLKYTNVDTNENVHSTTEVRTATLQLLQTINELGKNKKLCENTDITIELTYVDTTPVSYEPPGFEPSIEKYCMVAPNRNVHLGMVRTGFHNLRCYGSIEPISVAEQENTPQIIEITEGENEDVDESSKLKEEGKKADNVEVEEKEAVSVRVSNATRSPLKKLNMSNITISDDDDNSAVLSDGIELTEEHFICFCQLDLPLDLDRIECFNCGKRYHAPCYGYLCKEDASRNRFVCIECGYEDHILSGMPHSDRIILCRLRLILFYIDKSRMLPTNILRRFPINQRNKIIDKLKQYDILIGEKPSKIDFKNLRPIMQQYFKWECSQMF